MREWLKLSDKSKKEIITQASAISGLPPNAIEKDWWVTTSLRILFSLPVSQYLAFKGGTSLSKGWNLIDRFSEDIDIALDRDYLGFAGELSRTQVTKLRRASCSFINDAFVDMIEAKIEELEIPHFTITVKEFKDSDTDPLVIILKYNSLTSESKYLQPRILIEVGARSLVEPVEDRKIKSIVSYLFPNKDFSEEAIDIATVLPKRTFLEKAFLLHEEFQKPVDQIRVGRLSRHLYDLEKLSKTKHAPDAIGDTELYKAIISHRQKFNRIGGIDYDNHQPEKISFLPISSILKEIESDYKAMQESMIYGESLSFADLITEIEKLNNRFSEIRL
jgi:hypothetical protein